MDEKKIASDRSANALPTAYTTRLTAFRFICKVVVDFYPFAKTHFHVEVSKSGDVLFSTPDSDGVVARHIDDLYFDSGIRRYSEELFINDGAYQGHASEEGYHWRIGFYTLKGLYSEIEGRDGEEEWRREAFTAFLQNIEKQTGTYLGGSYLSFRDRQAAVARALDPADQPHCFLDHVERDAFASMVDMLLSMSAKQNPGKNMLISPASICIVLAILASAAKGRSAEEFQTLFGLTAAQLRKTASNINTFLQSGSAVAVANGLVVRSGCINKGFAEAVRDEFSAESFDEHATAAQINDWVDRNTRHMIPSIVRNISDLGDVAILNTVVFESKWQRHYEPWDITEGLFYDIQEQAEDVAMMHSSERMLILDSRAIGFIKPYRHMHYTFMALLPQETRDPIEMLNAMGPGGISKLYASAIDADVDVTMPEFGFDTNLSVKKALIDCGITSIFDSRTADISELIPVPNAYVSEIVHRSHIDVDRSGTRAAAVTVGAVCAGAAPALPKFKIVLNRPFLFAIVSHATGIPVFLGVVYSVRS